MRRLVCSNQTEAPGSEMHPAQRWQSAQPEVAPVRSHASAIRQNPIALKEGAQKAWAKKQVVTASAFTN